MELTRLALVLLVVVLGRAEVVNRTVDDVSSSLSYGGSGTWKTNGVKGIDLPWIRAWVCTESLAARFFLRGLRF